MDLDAELMKHRKHRERTDVEIADIKRRLDAIDGKKAVSKLTPGETAGGSDFEPRLAALESLPEARLRQQPVKDQPVKK